MPRETWRFKSRWRIEAVLETNTPLRVGSGFGKENTEIHPDGLKVEVSAVTLAHDGKPCIPGSSLKGNLRAWIEPRVRHPELIEAVFGADSRTGRSGRGGKAEIWDAEWLQGPEESGLPGWCPKTGTAIEASVAIERLTRTARDQKLFHRAVVAPRSRFGMVITGENLDEREVALLVAALQGFDDPDDPILLGAETGSGKGRLTLGRESPVLQRIGPDELLAWLDETNPAKAGPAFRVLTDRERESIFDTAAELTSRASGSQVALDVDIRMDGPFLVNDPQPKRDSNSSHEDGPPDHRPRRDHAGRTLLPAKSVRGVLRARAERVVRTLGGHACRVDDPRAACDAIDDLAEIQNLCLACRTFGAPGWRSPLAVSDFTLVEERSTALRQEFVAIDRFTGGGAEKLKFNAEAAIDPHFKGEIGFDLLRGELWMAGLLALVLRDMCEGDLTFGFGAAKGYGAAVAFVSGWRLGGLDAPPVTAALSNIDIAADALPQEGTALTPAIAAALEKTIQAFRSKIRGEGT